MRPINGSEPTLAGEAVEIASRKADKSNHGFSVGPIKPKDGQEIHLRSFGLEDGKFVGKVYGTGRLFGKPDKSIKVSISDFKAAFSAKNMRPDWNLPLTFSYSEKTNSYTVSQPLKEKLLGSIRTSQVRSSLIEDLDKEWNAMEVGSKSKGKELTSDAPPPYPGDIPVVENTNGRKEALLAFDENEARILAKREPLSQEQLEEAIKSANKTDVEKNKDVVPAEQVETEKGVLDPPDLSSGKGKYNWEKWPTNIPQSELRNHYQKYGKIIEKFSIKHDEQGAIFHDKNTEKPLFREDNNGKRIIVLENSDDAIKNALEYAVLKNKGASDKRISLKGNDKFMDRAIEIAAKNQIKIDKNCLGERQEKYDRLFAAESRKNIEKDSLSNGAKVEIGR